MGKCAKLDLVEQVHYRFIYIKKLLLLVYFYQEMCQSFPTKLLQSIHLIIQVHTILH